MYYFHIRCSASQISVWETTLSRPSLVLITLVTHGISVERHSSLTVIDSKERTERCKNRSSRQWWQGRGFGAWANLQLGTSLNPIYMRLCLYNQLVNAPLWDHESATINDAGPPQAPSVAVSRPPVTLDPENGHSVHSWYHHPSQEHRQNEPLWGFWNIAVLRSWWLWPKAVVCTNTGACNLTWCCKTNGVGIESVETGDCE